MKVEDLTDEFIKSHQEKMVGKPCFVCESPADTMGIFTPKDSERYGAPKGKQRLLFYPICWGCRGEENLEKVNKKIVANFMERN